MDSSGPRLPHGVVREPRRPRDPRLFDSGGIERVSLCVPQAALWPLGRFAGELDPLELDAR